MRLPELIAVTDSLGLLKLHDTINTEHKKPILIEFNEEVRFTIEGGIEYDVISFIYTQEQYDQYPGYKDINMLQVYEGKQVVPNTDRRRQLTEDNKLCIMLDKVLQFRRTGVL
jgi:hypothetical protein